MKRYMIELSARELDAIEFIIELGHSDIGNTDCPAHKKHHRGIKQLFNRLVNGNLAKVVRVREFNS